MEYRRYGKFRFSDYWSAWIGIISLSIIVVVGIAVDLSAFFISFGIMFIAFMVWTVLSPHQEFFSICGNDIVVRRRRKSYRIHIPENPTIIISYADVRSSIAKRVGAGNQAIFLKGKYAVSILQNTPLNVALDHLHKKYIWRYATSTVESVFDNSQIVHSFVCEQDVLDKIIQGRDCLLIIPETLVEIVSINNKDVNIFVDTGY